MDIEAYMQKQLSDIPIHRLKVRTEIELRGLLLDHEICQWDCHYIRDEAGHRSGIRYLYKVNPKDTHVITADITSDATA